MNTERSAFLLALKAHEHQRYGDDPYMVHLFDVVKVLLRFQHTEPTLLAAAWLHDIIEDTPLHYKDVEEATSKAVAEIVLVLTDEIGRNRKERKEKTLPKLKGNLMAQIVKLADWIANVEDAYLNKPKLIQMYQKDYPGFAEMCKGEFELLEPMWVLLDRLVGSGAPAPEKPKKPPMSLMEEATYEQVEKAKLEMLDELERRVNDAYSHTDIQSARHVALKVIRAMRQEMQ